MRSCAFYDISAESGGALLWVGYGVSCEFSDCVVERSSTPGVAGGVSTIGELDLRGCIFRHAQANVGSANLPHEPHAKPSCARLR